MQEVTRRDMLLTAGAMTALMQIPKAHAKAAVTPGQKVAFDGVDKAIGAAVDAKQVPATVAVAANPDGIFYSGSWGRQKGDEGAAVDGDTVFWIASMTKAITATAAMQLVEQGKLSLDQEMGKLLPYLATVQVLEGFDAQGAPKLRPPKRPITLRHLLTHTAGFVYSIWDENMARYEKATGTPFIGTCETASLKAPLLFDPGERWEYGINIDWAGRAVEAVADQSLAVYFRENIFNPLSMESTGFLIGSAQKNRLAAGYTRNADGTLAPASPPFGMPQRPEFFMGGGALFSTPNDYMQFLQMLLQDGSLGRARILKPETVAQMMENHIGDLKVVTLKTVAPALSKDANFFPNMVQKWGLSFDINTEVTPTGRSAGSVCWAGLFNTYFWLDPKKKITGTIMTQLLPFADDKVLETYATFEKGMYNAMTA